MRLAVVAMALAGAGCPVEECTEATCPDGLHVDFSPHEGWPEGSYRFVVESDGRVANCYGAIPIETCDGSATWCDAPGVLLADVGCTRPDAQGFGSILFSDDPTEVSVEVWFQDALMASGSWVPVYDTLAPNGPDCEPQCRIGRAQLDVPLP